MCKVILVVALALAGSSTNLLAQDGPSGSQQERQTCARDASRYCRKEMKISDNAVQQCLMQHRENLTRACRKVFEDHGQ